MKRPIALEAFIDINRQDTFTCGYWGFGQLVVVCPYCDIYFSGPDYSQDVISHVLTEHAVKLFLWRWTHDKTV